MDAEQLVGEIAEEVGTYQSKLDADDKSRPPRAKMPRDSISMKRTIPRTSGARRSRYQMNYLQRLLVLQPGMVMDERLGHLMSSEMPCSAISAKPTGRRLNRPRAACIRGGLINVRRIDEPRPRGRGSRVGQEKEQAADNVDPNAHWFGDRRINRSTRTCSLTLSVWAAQQHHCR